MHASLWEGYEYPNAFASWGLFWQGPGIFARNVYSDMFCQLYNMHNSRHAQETASAVRSVFSSLPAELLNVKKTDSIQRKRHFFPRRDGPLSEEGGSKDFHFKGVEEGPQVSKCLKITQTYWSVAKQKGILSVSHSIMKILPT